MNSIMVVLQLILSGCIGYILKQLYQASLIYRQKVVFQSIDEAKAMMSNLVAELGRIEHIATIGFGSGCAAVYTKLIQTGSHGFEAKFLVFPLIGMVIAGVMKPFLALMLERPLNAIDGEIVRLEGIKGKKSEEDITDGVEYELVDQE